MANSSFWAKQPPVGSVLNASHPQSHGCVGAWTFNEGGGPSVRDASGNRNTGTLTNGPVWGQAPLYGTAISFDGTDDYVDVGNNASLTFDGTLKFSLCFWAKGSSSQTSGAGVIAKGNGGGGEQYVIDVASNLYRFYTRDSGGGVGSNISAAVGPNNTLQFVVGTFDNSRNLVVLYVNGISAATGTTGGSLQATTHITSVGARQSAGAGYDLAYLGFINNVRIYNRALLHQEVQALYAYPYIDYLLPRRRNIVQQAAGASIVPILQSYARRRHL